MYSFLWWLRQIILLLAGCFFLAFGIHMLVASYTLKDPYSFIMAFFASNLIILISATLILGFVIRMVRVGRVMKDDN